MSSLEDYWDKLEEILKRDKVQNSLSILKSGKLYFFNIQ